ncbi:MAG: hypothetical protein DKT66_18335 [Candidatus Melainabacteria bacterium]|nr:MAG: hypothetical protein DKT66_18335 [Candidatus Melainabacteria bacterium]
MDSGNQTPADQVRDIHPTVFTGPAAGEVGSPILQTGEIIADRYKVVQLLGHGGMGSVYKVEQIYAHQLFALKTLSGQNYPDVAIRRFQKEAQAAMKLNHTNLVRAHDFGILPTHQPFYIMDLIEGENLSEYAKRVGTLPLDEILRIFIPICFALAYAHSEGIVHRDIKPGNIMLDKSGGNSEPYVPKIVDFGIAKLTDTEGGESANLTRTGEIFGTPLYMSPEQCLGVKIDHRTDIYSLGCVMYEVLTGAPPFHGESALNLMMKHQSEQSSSLKEGSMGREFPEMLEAIVAKTLEKDPDSRYQNLLDLAEDLSLLQRSTSEQTGSLTIAKTMPQIARLAPAKGKPLSWKITTLTGIICLLVGGVCGFLLKKEPEQIVVKPPIDSFVENKPVDKDIDLLANGQYFQKTGKIGSLTTRIFQFPETFSIGLLTYVDSAGQLIQSRPATGTVEIPMTSEIRLSVKQSTLRKHPNLLKPFGEYDIGYIHLQRSKDSVNFNPDVEFDAALVYCAHWKALNYLNVFDTAVSDVGLRCLKDCPSLINLELISTKCTAAGVRQLKLYPNFATIGLNGISGGKSLIPDISKSIFLNSFGGDQMDLTDDDVRMFAHSKKLVMIGLRRNKRITDKSTEYLRQLPLLSVMCVEGTSISPKSMSNLAAMKNLSHLTVSADLWTPSDLKKLQAMAPQLKRLQALD